MLTGAQGPANREGNFDNHPSLDFYLHGLLGAPVLPTASVSGAGTWKCMSFDAAGIGREPETNPADLFRQCFPADFMRPTPPPKVEKAPAEKAPPVVTEDQVNEKTAGDCAKALRTELEYKLLDRPTKGE